MKPASRFTAGLLALGVALLMGACASPSPLLSAAERGDMEAVRSLLDQGANINERATFPCSPLDAAAYNGHPAVVQFLLDKGADINAKCRDGSTPFHSAVFNGHADIIRLLLDRGADVNSTYASLSASGMTALHFAALHGRLDIVQLLLERGAQCCEATSQGDTPLKYAKEKGHVAIARLLEQAETRQFGTPPPPASLAVSAAPPVVTAPASDVDMPLTRRAKSRTNAYAVVIGIEQYQQKLPKADFAAHDAEIMGQYLIKTLGYAEENVVVLLNDRATKTGVEKYIEHWLPDRVEKDASVFIYYSGHGAPNPKTSDAYLVPYDGDPAFVDATGYPLKRLYERVSKLPAKEIVVMLDSCFSGAGGRSVIAEGARPMMLSVENPVLAGNKTVVLAASSGTQISSTFKDQGHGLLTYYFLKGLRGEADANKDGGVDLAEVFAYLKPQVERTARREFHNEQTPQLIGNPDLLNKGIRLIEGTNPTKP